MSLLGRVAFLLSVLGLGVVGRRFDLLSQPLTDRLNTVAFYVILPALVFDSTYDAPLETLLSPMVVGGQLGTMAVILALAALLHRRIDSREKRSVAIVQSYHSNVGYLGLPIVAATLGDAAAGTASLILGVGVLVQVPTTVMILTVVAEADADVVAEIRRVLRNPVLLGIVAGIGVSFLELSVPDPAAQVVSLLSSTALPVALLLVGASLSFDLPEGEFGTLGTVVSLKLLVMPAIAWAVFSSLGVSGSSLAAGVVMLGAPTAISTYIYAEELGGDARLASRTIFVTTLVWTVTVFALLEIVG